MQVILTCRANSISRPYSVLSSLPFKEYYRIEYTSRYFYSLSRLPPCTEYAVAYHTSVQDILILIPQSHWRLPCKECSLLSRLADSFTRNLLVHSRHTFQQIFFTAQSFAWHPLPRKRVCLPPLGSWGGGQTRLRGLGAGGGPITTKGQTLWYSTYTL